MFAREIPSYIYVRISDAEYRERFLLMIDERFTANIHLLSENANV